MPGIDPLDSLAFAVYSNHGVYAALVGSGVSSAAGIKTGYEITLDLCVRLAKVNQENPEPDPASWYASRYGRPPEYSDLLARLASTPDERQAILRPYFEPTEEDRERGLKLPTRAHRAIAELVKRGYIRVVLTTNFDQLFERSIADTGTTPIVSSTEDQALGMPPLTHGTAVVIKPNGDYTDPRIRNTAAEVASYGPGMTALINRVFDEFGLIVVGWSATWDRSIVEAFERSANRRYSTFWVARSQPKAEAARLIELRGAAVVASGDAEASLSALATKVQSLEALDAGHPLSPTIAVATLRRQLLDPVRVLEVEDLIRTEAERVVDVLVGREFNKLEEITPAVLQEHLDRNQALLATLGPLFCLGGWGDDGMHAALWPAVVTRLANAVDVSGARPGQWNAAFRHPAMLLFSAAGTNAFAAGNSVTLDALLRDANVRVSRMDKPAWSELASGQVLDAYRQKELLRGPMKLGGMTRDRILEWSRVANADRVATERSFYRFEYLLGLLEADRLLQSNEPFADVREKVYLPGGAFVYERWPGGSSEAIDVLKEEFADLGDHRFAAIAPRFGGERERLEAANVMAREAYGVLRQRWM